MNIIKKIFFSFLCAGALAASFSAPMASTLVLQPMDDTTHNTHSQKSSFVDQRLARQLYDISHSLISHLEDNFTVNHEFLQLLEKGGELGGFSNWMTSKIRTVTQEEKIYKTKFILKNIESNYQSAHLYESWIVDYSEGKNSAEQLFESIMTIYLVKSKDRAQGLVKGDSIPPTLEKHISDLDQYSQSLAQYSIDTHTLLYLLLETLYDSIEVKNISPQSQNILKNMPVLSSLLEGRSAVGPNPDLSLLDGAILLSGEYTSSKSMPKKISFRGLRDDYKKSFSILKSISERKIIVKGRPRESLYKISDFLPIYEDIKDVTSPLMEKKRTSNTAEKSKKRKKNKRKQGLKKIKPQASVVEAVVESTPSTDIQGATVVFDKQEKESVTPDPKTLPLREDEITLSTSSDVSDDFEGQNNQENMDPRVNNLATSIETVVDHRPVLHQKRWNLLNSFWEDRALSYQNFTTLFEGFNGEIKQTKGGSSHVKLFFTTPEGQCLVNGTWRPHPTPVFKGRSLKHLQDYFKDCGFIPENYQSAR